MLILVGVLVIVVAVMVLGSAARERPTFSATVAVAAGAGFVGLVVLAALVLGVRGSGGGNEIEERPDVTPTTVERPDTSQIESPATRGIDLVIDARIRSERFNNAVPALGDLPDESTAVVVVASGEALVLQQCVTSAGHHRRECEPGVPAGSFGSRAAGLVELRRVLELESGTYDCSLQRCELVATVAGTPKVFASAVLVFGESAKAPTLEVRPNREVRPGEVLDVEVSDLAARERVRITWCVPPGRWNQARAVHLPPSSRCAPTSPALPVGASQCPSATPVPVMQGADHGRRVPSPSSVRRSPASPSRSRSQVCRAPICRPAGS